MFLREKYFLAMTEDEEMPCSEKVPQAKCHAVHKYSSFCVLNTISATKIPDVRLVLQKLQVPLERVQADALETTVQSQRWFKMHSEG